MPTIKQFLLPDPAEGLTEADIVTWKVAVGDTVEINQPIVDIETAKSLVELPCPFAGLVVELLVSEGETVEVGTPIISIDIDPDGSTPAGEAPAGQAVSRNEPATAESPTPTLAPADPTTADSATAQAEPAEERQAVLVGYGPKTNSPKRRPRRAWPKAFGPGSGVALSASNVLQDEFSAQRPVSMPVAPPPPPRPVVPVDDSVHLGLPPVGEVQPPPPLEDVRKKAKPPVRKLARDLGIDLATVDGTGVDGLVTRGDVEAAARGATSAGPLPSEPVAGPREERIPITGVRKFTAEAMVRSAFSAPHVTEWVSVDVTRSLELLARLKARKDFDGVKLTPLALIARALCLAIRRNPGINASWDGDSGHIVLKHYVNLGIAASTPRGLLVPNIKDAHTLDLRALATALADLTRTARDGGTPPAAMQGGTITITNVGVFGVDGGTPIINPPEAAILAVGQVRPMPWVVDGEIAVRQVLQLTLSFDHRLVDGDLGSRVLADVAAVLEQPELALAWA